MDIWEELIEDLTLAEARIILNALHDVLGDSPYGRRLTQGNLENTVRTTVLWSLR